MFIQLKDGRKLNLIYLSDCFIGKHDKTAVIFYLVNGTKLVEQYETPVEAETRLTEMKDTMENAGLGGGGLVQAETRADFPMKGKEGTIYLAKDTGQTYYWDRTTETYIKTGTAGRTGVYSVNQDLPATIGATTTIKKADLEVLVAPTTEFAEGSDVIGKNSVRAIITAIGTNDVTVRTTTDLVIDSFKQVISLDELPKQGIANILYFVKEIDEFRVWDDEVSAYVEPYHPVILVDAPVEEARVNTLYIIGNEIKYTTDNKEWTYVTSAPDLFEMNTAYFKGKLLYIDNTLVKVLEDYTSSNADKPVDAFEADIETGKLEVIISGRAGQTKTYDLTDQLDGTKQTFTIPNTITKDSSVMVFYAGQLLVKDVNYTLDFAKHTVTTMFEEAPTAEEDRHLVLVVGEMVDQDFIFKSITDVSNGNLVAKAEIKQEAEDLIIDKIDVNVKDNSSIESKITIKSSNDTVKFEVTETNGNKNIDITSIGNVTLLQNIFKFNGTKVTFDLPSELNLDKPVLVLVNGVAQTEGADYDYVIDKTNKTITFALAFEELSNNTILNFE